MKTNKISEVQIISIMILFIIGSTLVTGGCMKAQQNSWISLLIAFILSVPLVIMYSRIGRRAQQKDIFDLSYLFFGKIGGAIITAIFSIYSISLGILVINNFTEYIQVVALPETPKYINAIFIGLTAYLVLKLGIEILGRGSAFMAPVVIATIILTTILSVNDIDISNIKPILIWNNKEILSCTFSMITFPFGETVLFISIFPTVKSKTNPTKLYLIALLISAILLEMVMLRNIMVLGLPLAETLYFPSYSAVSIIDIGTFLSRIEVLVSVNFIVLGLAKVTVCLYVGCKGIAKLFNFSNYKSTLLPTAIIMIVVSGLIFENTIQMFKFIDIYKYYAPVFQMLIPVVILVILEIKTRKNKRNINIEITVDQQQE